MAFYDNLRAPYADFSPPCTVLGKNVPWRPFQGMIWCGSLAGIHSLFRGSVQVKTDNVEHVNLLDDNKDIRVDVECYDKDGTRFVCEVQVAPQHHFYERAVFNSSLAIQKQKFTGETAYDFPTVYFIGLMDFSMHRGSGQVDFRYDLREKRSGELMTPRLQYVFLELPNALPRALTPEASILDNICYALHEMEHLTERPAELKQEIFKLLFNSAELSNFTPDERAKYQLDMTTERDIHNQIAYARDEGMEEGMKKGMEKGMEKGTEKGFRLMADQLREMGMPEREIERIVEEAEKKRINN